MGTERSRRRQEPRKGCRRRAVVDVRPAILRCLRVPRVSSGQTSAAPSWIRGVAWGQGWKVCAAHLLQARTRLAMPRRTAGPGTPSTAGPSELCGQPTRLEPNEAENLSYTVPAQMEQKGGGGVTWLRVPSVDLRDGRPLAPRAVSWATEPFRADERAVRDAAATRLSN